MKDKLNILQKLMDIEQECPVIPKTGEGDDYKYAKEQDVKSTLKPLLIKYNVKFLITSLCYDSSSENRVDYATVYYKFIDLESGEYIKGKASGSGWDQQDKGLYIAYTGAVKNILMNTFNMSTSEDPEQNTPPPMPDNAREKPTTTKETVQKQEKQINGMVDNISKEKERLDSQLSNMKEKRQQVQTTFAPGHFRIKENELKLMKAGGLVGYLQDTFQINVDDYVEGRKTAKAIIPLILDCDKYGVKDGRIDYPPDEDENTSDEPQPEEEEMSEAIDDIPLAAPRTGANLDNTIAMFDEFDAELISAKMDEITQNKYLNLENFFATAPPVEIQQLYVELTGKGKSDQDN